MYEKDIMNLRYTNDELEYQIWSKNNSIIKLRQTISDLEGRIRSKDKDEKQFTVFKEQSIISRRTSFSMKIKMDRKASSSRCVVRRICIVKQTGRVLALIWKQLLKMPSLHTKILVLNAVTGHLRLPFRHIGTLTGD
jgi:lipopolysaccharide biosynthesis protein